MLRIQGKLRTFDATRCLDNLIYHANWFLNYSLCLNLDCSTAETKKRHFGLLFMKSKFYINCLHENFTLILLMSFSSALSKIKVPESSVEVRHISLRLRLNQKLSNSLICLNNFLSSSIETYAIA